MTRSSRKPGPDAAIYAPCTAIAGAMIGHFATRLEVEAGKAGGTLDAAAIRSLAERFLAEEQARFGATFQRSWDECTRLRAARLRDTDRERAFDRILECRFAPLLPRDGRDGVLSRRMLPGFHMVVEKSVGPALLEQCQRKSLAIFDRHRSAGGEIDWDALHADPDARALADDVLTVLARSFTQFEHRRGWVIDLVNSHLAPPEASTADALWRLTEHGFAELMRALYAELRAAHDSEPEALRRRYGATTVTRLGVFLRRLDWE